MSKSECLNLRTPGFSWHSRFWTLAPVGAAKGAENQDSRSVREMPQKIAKCARFTGLESARRVAVMGKKAVNHESAKPTKKRDPEAPPFFRLFRVFVLS